MCRRGSSGRGNTDLVTRGGGDVIFSVSKTKGVRWVAVEGEPSPLQEADTHDDASTGDRAVATLHVRGPGAVLGCSRSAHSAEWARLGRPTLPRSPGSRPGRAGVGTESGSDRCPERFGGPGLRAAAGTAAGARRPDAAAGLRAGGPGAPGNGGAAVDQGGVPPGAAPSGRRPRGRADPRGAGPCPDRLAPHTELGAGGGAGFPRRGGPMTGGPCCWRG